MGDRIDEFVIEAREHLNGVEECLLALEKSPSLVERIDRCFRSIHSIKGDAGFLGLSQIRDLAHAMESILGNTRAPAPQSTIETLLAARDWLAVLVDSASQSHLIDISEILIKLGVASVFDETIAVDVDLAIWNAGHPGGLSSFIHQWIDRGQFTDGQIQLHPCDLRRRLPTGSIRWTGSIKSSPQVNVPPEWPDADAARMVLSRRLTANLSEWSQTETGLRSRFQRFALAGSIGAPQVSFPLTDLRRGLPESPVIWSGECKTTLTQNELAEIGVTFDEVTDPAATTGRTLDIASNIQPASNARRANGGETTMVAETSNLKPVTRPAEGDKSTTLRIQVELLDRMMTLVGELTLVRNQSLLAFDGDGPQRAIIQRLNSVTSELQDVTLRARMQPVSNLFNKFPRMVRDLARQLGKQVELDLQGGEVELDKSILEQLSDPLMHLIRNGVDHGIESPDERLSMGKPAIGRIVLSASHEEGQVQIRIRDDGRGIDSDAVKAKALSLGLRSPAEVNRMSPRELYSLTLLPGFSTAKQLTEVSGRGVGLDVVKTNIERLEGSLQIDSDFGKGLTMTLRLPLTLAIIPCLIVTVSGEVFAIPQRDVDEVIALHPRSSDRIEHAFNTEVYRLRDRLLPIVRFSEVLRRKTPFSAEAKTEILAENRIETSRARIEFILVLRPSGRRFGLVVDQVKGTQEIVVKPMHSSMKRIGIFTGATIMGDGKIALIADAEGIVEHARLSFEFSNEPDTAIDVVRDAAEVHRVLLFEYGPRERFALPLVQIRRIEMLATNTIERIGDHEYVTVDGVSTRILRLDRVINVSAHDADFPLMSLVLPKFVAQPMGILVSRIVDTESLALDLQNYTDDEQAILGTAIVRDRLTLFLDMHRLSERLFNNNFAVRQAIPKGSKLAKRLLLIDDTAFFREVVKRYLAAEGHEIITAIHGQDGLAKLDGDSDFDLIVSDIEMPVMDGWEFAREVRRRGFEIPMLALTSLSGMEYEFKARDCGYDGYEVKLDHDRLVRKVHEMLAAVEVIR